MRLYPDSLRKLNIRTRIMLFLLLGIILFSSILLYISKMLSQNLVENDFYDYLKVTQQEMEKGVELFITEINMLTVRLLQNDSMYSLMSDDTLSFDEKQQKYREVLDNMVIDWQVVGDIIVIDRKGKQYSFSNESALIQRPDNIYIDRMKNNQQLITWGPVMRDAKNNSYIPLGKRYQNFSTGQKIGYMIVYIKEASLFDIYKKVTPDMGYSFLLSGDGYIISHPDKTKVGNTIFDNELFKLNDSFSHYIGSYNGQASIFAASRFNDRLRTLGCDWEIISIVPQERLFERIKSINLYIILIELIMSAIAIILSTRISLKLVEPVRQLKSKLRNFGKGSVLKLSFVEKTDDEIWELEKTYNEMISRISDLVSKNNEEKEKQRKLELTALQAQINPHFLYNTLDAIGWMAKIKKQSDIEMLVMALSRFFRISLHKGEKYITLREEIELVQSFLTIEQIRFPDKFEVEYNISEELLDCKVLKLTLQPIAENAIKHGISMQRGKGLITINGSISGDDLLLEVLDNGAGFDPSGLEPAIAGEYRHGGYGIHNVDERIRLEYGESYGIKISSKKGEGTRVEIKLKADFISE